MQRQVVPEPYEGLGFAMLAVSARAMLKARSKAKCGLIFGVEGAMWECCESGIVVADVHEDWTEPFDFPLLSVMTGPDSRFVQTLSGRYVRSVTVAEIFTQFAGPYDFISIRDTGRDRDIWYTDQVQDAIPDVYVLGEDGHNEGVIKRAKDRGYHVFLCTDTLVMVHERAVKACP